MKFAFAEFTAIAERKRFHRQYARSGEYALIIGIDFDQAEGAAAGKKTQTDKIGFVGGMDIPLIRRFLAGYKYGAEYVNPGVEVSWKYVENWADPAKGKKLAISLYDEGVDIVCAVAGRSGLGAIEAANERGKLVIGVNADQCDTI